ncbi:PAQR family membrane homeostasis protein TrhA [Lentilactobacillus laojiaonis]|uniref:PAQR family membrane homeostasis protein TrhA n=1 Tax=Lentilactobacillus laojiaonis TaxID=2883998 RepID=UPI001D09A4EE|nr:hemolysin III family protein [Lentilactobacillus laojiaonis]UDM31982.1 hemolysin III family protein [Lentilactobacillus laojiaonis]
MNNHVRVYEFWNIVTHSIALLVSLFGSYFLINKSVQLGLSGYNIFALAVYCICLLILYLNSSLYHLLVNSRVSRLFQIMDHTSIYLLIAGTYTPYCLVILHSNLGNLMLIFIWILAIFGIINHLVSKGKHQKLETTIYVLMGWCCLLAGKQLFTNLTGLGFWLLVAGGITFTLGAFIYSFPAKPIMHVIWHFLVMLGTSLMFISIYYNI